MTSIGVRGHASDHDGSRRLEIFISASWRRLLCAGLLLGCAGFWIGVPAASAAENRALGEAVLHDGAHRVRAQIVVHPDDQPRDDQPRDGRPSVERVRLGVLFDLDPGWHIYARDPGDSGIPTKLHWTIADADVGPVAWPEHRTFSEADGLLETNGYANEVLLASAARFSAPAIAGHPLQVEIDGLACLVECIPLQLTLTSSLADAAGGPDDDIVRSKFDRYAGGLGSLERTAPEAEETGLLALLGLAFLGGLILNAMPCVLPVLAIKLFGLADLAQRARREVVVSAVAYALGVLATMLALAGVVVLLRAAGTAVGWGFQFQEPAFVAAVSTVLVVFALNLFGVFEFRWTGGGLANVGNDAVGARRSFFEGLLVVVLATPCSAPFLGTAVGIAFASSTATILAVFAAIGLGLASPYLLIAGSPKLARFVPRSGTWMLHLRTGLGFGLLATTVWLLWVFGRTVGSDGMAGLLALLVTVGFSVWLYGLLQRQARPGMSLSVGIAALLLVGFGLNGIRTDYTAGEAPAQDVGTSDWLPYEPAAVAERLAAGHTVFVSFTADWCITCKVNEHRVLADARVVDAFSQLGIARFEADWTRRDESIRQELERFGRAGVPMYLVYRPESPEDPQQLPELLRIDDVLGAISNSQQPASVIQNTPLTADASM